MTSTWTSGRIRYLAIAAVTVLAILLTSTPEVSWDFLPYTAIVLEAPEKSYRDVHRETYAAVSEFVSPGDFWALTTISEYRKATQRDPLLFARQLEGYRQRPLFIALVRVARAAFREPAPQPSV
jgi:hypothetical protein